MNPVSVVLTIYGVSTAIALIAVLPFGVKILRGISDDRDRERDDEYKSWKKETDEENYRIYTEIITEANDTILASPCAGCKNMKDMQQFINDGIFKYRLYGTDKIYMRERFYATINDKFCVVRCKKHGKLNYTAVASNLYCSSYEKGN